MNQLEKGRAFRALHERQRLFVIPNPWDGGTAKLLASMGFEALTTTSAGIAFGLGRPDGAISRDESLANARLIVDSVDIPVAADLENGFGHRPEDAAETIRRAAEIGLVGGSIEDATGDPAHPIYDLALAVERVAAAAEAARGLDFPFTFVARAENYLHGRADLDDTLRRLQAYENAGADVLFAPGLPGLEAIRTTVQSLRRPLNVVRGGPGPSLDELEAAGVRRVSVGGAFSRLALTAVRNAAAELLSSGTFGFAEGLMSTAEAATIMAKR
ncbi:MAG TPA: isocitrate lyase/phosphoenolpyruvate mutase family protein [Devosia sp.]|nr:isocitrate lyase/phosphoenolpyruvate mutase family protein [Devosia sp.]